MCDFFARNVGFVALERIECCLHSAQRLDHSNVHEAKLAKTLRSTPPLSVKCAGSARFPLNLVRDLSDCASNAFREVALDDATEGI